MSFQKIKQKLKRGHCAMPANFPRSLTLLTSLFLVGSLAIVFFYTCMYASYMLDLDAATRIPRSFIPPWSKKLSHMCSMNWMAKYLMGNSPVEKMQNFAWNYRIFLLHIFFIEYYTCQNIFSLYIRFVERFIAICVLSAFMKQLSSPRILKRG